ncbi:glutamate--cysteine ligase [Vibrio sp. SCSIO 43137]|uniref:glutamate--cysteine ligase n=1 Tax=Vibrio sp. SCSIO 43137 TaxID=3021011 RepID=UPI002306F0D4|nr:glutamate--cysteine ligase [Vibrio sp. SCSIO 43137]WCE29244.1 glutamate--cysteine ligase [Vibrio sp. SCSIO 43137]
MTNFSSRLNKVAKNPHSFTQFSRGVERETLRYTPGGKLASTPHPEGLGAALTNKWITTDFSESLLEFITPVSSSVDELLGQLSDIHHFTQKQSGEEKFWPLSMPCYVENEDDIEFAQYGSSNVGKMKTLYRKGLKNRYGSLMQIISGVHFNFSFPESVWDALFGEQSEEERAEAKSDAYFGLIRNYYHYGWLIPYLFGASPAICPSFLQGRKTDLPFENIGQTKYLPYATSLRLSDLGYTNSAQSALNIGYNNLDEYLDGLNAAIHTPSEEFAKIGIKVDGEYQQLNANVLQIENELYAPIRAKRVSLPGEKPSEALKRAGVEYIEVRSLDVNPFSPVGITQQQIRFLDLFLTWCLIKDCGAVDNQQLCCWKDNWNKVILEGRKPGLMLKELSNGCDGKMLSLHDYTKQIFSDLKLIAKEMDQALGGTDYQDTCEELVSWIDNPELTISGRLLEKTKQLGGIGDVGCTLGMEYREHHLNNDYRIYSEQEMRDEAEKSVRAQKEIEQADTVSFEQFLSDYFSYIK